MYESDLILYIPNETLSNRLFEVKRKTIYIQIFKLLQECQNSSPYATPQTILFLARSVMPKRTSK